MTLEANNGISVSMGTDGLCGNCRFRAEALQVEINRRRMEVAHDVWEIVLYALFPLACLAATIFAGFRLTYEYTVVYGLAIGAKGLAPFVDTFRKARNGGG